MGKNRDVRLKRIPKEELDEILKNPQLFKHRPNLPIEICDPYFTTPCEYISDGDRNYDVEMEELNKVYEDEIKEDKLRYPLILEMEAKKKERLENPIIFDKEEEYYETDPHKLVNYDKVFAPFFDKETNDIFFRNIKHPIRIKWESIPEEDRNQKIVHLDQSVRKLGYDEIENYMVKYIINKDIPMLFFKFLPSVWPISSFLGEFAYYLKDYSNYEMYDFLIERVLLLGSVYDFNSDEYPLHDEELDLETVAHLKTGNEREAIRYMQKVKKVKNKMFNDVAACIKVEEVPRLYIGQEPKDFILAKSNTYTQPDLLIETDILEAFIKKYNLYQPAKTEEITTVYNYPAIAKLIIILNLAFFNIFPLTLEGYGELRKSNRVLFVHFLWYLKDFFWEFYESPIKSNRNIQDYFTEREYKLYSKMLEVYPSQLVTAKEYFYTTHNTILREVAASYLDDYYDSVFQNDKQNYRTNADYYLLNQELQKYEKLKEKIYAKSRTLKRSEEKTTEIISNAYCQHKRNLAYLEKVFLRSDKEQNLKTQDGYREFYLDKNKTQLIGYSYPELISQTKEKFIRSLIHYNAYEKLLEQHKTEPKQFTKPMDIYTKLLDKKLIEPNLWNKFDDYCYMAIDKYPNKLTPISKFYTYQDNFIVEFMRDIMLFWGSEGSNYVPQGVKPMLSTRKRKPRIKKEKNPIN